MKNKEWLSQEDCYSLRTLAIICIVLHNFTHCLPGASRENEFTFSFDNVVYFYNSILSSDFFIHLFSFWGHLGVPIFVFLSAFGLSQKYGNMNQLNVFGFLFKHYKKLFYPLLFGTISYLVDNIARRVPL